MKRNSIDFVQFGVPFTEICDREYGHNYGFHMASSRGGSRGTDGAGGNVTSKLIRRVPVEIPWNPNPHFEVDWTNLKIDTDKQTYFLNLLEREFPGQVGMHVISLN